MAAILKTEEDGDILKTEDQREKLVELIESQFGLLEKLLKMHAITRNQLEQIECEQTRVKINKMMLDYIFKEKKHEDLITALSESCQSHVVNWIKSGGEYSEEFGFDWPLTERQHEILDANLEELIDIIDNCELTSMLYSGKVINKRQRDVLDSKTANHVKNKALLEMVRRLSQRSFQTLINCLRKSSQGHIADILENGGALVRVHATLETDNLDETETQIANEFTNLLLQRNASAEQAIRAFNAAQLNIIAVKRGQSIVLYICCRKENEFNDLCKMIDNSEMKKFLEELFVALTYNIKLKVLSVKIYESDINKAREMFRRMKELKNKGTEGDSSFTSKEDSTSSSSFGNYKASISQEPQSQPHKVKDSIDRHYEFLVDRMFPEKLNLCITITQIYAIVKKETARKKNELIIKYLIEDHREEKLFEALDKSDQTHLVKYLENDGSKILKCCN